ncbi:MAG: SDR family oxidoreductase [Alphaproteobacteria bacterium]|nr:SDR family oxidoreductase [Alphaproteobacteria bacterium]
MNESFPHIVKPAVHDKTLFCFGYGYSALHVSERLRQFGWTVRGTTTDPEKQRIMSQGGVDAEMFDIDHPLLDPHASLSDVTHLLLSIPPGGGGDPAFILHAGDIAAMPKLEWVGYLSTTGVYGNQDGRWVTEATRPRPTSRRGDLRLKAEQQWQSLHLHEGLPLHTFRLSGIYGPGRSAIDAVRAGTARRIEKPGHVFNRVHVDDIVQALVASVNTPNPGAIYNVADDVPSSSSEVITFACDLLGISPPPQVAFDQVEMAPIVRSFYADNKRVKNDRIKDELGVTLMYPDYRAGLTACFDLEAQAMGFLNLS